MPVFFIMLRGRLSLGLRSDMKPALRRARTWFSASEQGPWRAGVQCLPRSGFYFKSLNVQERWMVATNQLWGNAAPCRVDWQLPAPRVRPPPPWEAL